MGKNQQPKTQGWHSAEDQGKKKWSEGWSKVLNENNSYAWKNLSYIENSVVTTEFPT